MKRNSAHQAHLRRQIAASKPNCWLCGEEIEYGAHHLNPRSFVIDHVVPIALGGLDALSNVKAAHRLASATVRSEHA